jgi:hypothetical protein
MNKIVRLKFVISTNFDFWKCFIILKRVKLNFSARVQSVEFLMGYLPIYLDVIFYLVREKNKKKTCFRKLRRGVRVVRIVLRVKVLYHIQSIYFLNKVCTRDHELSFKKKFIRYNNPTLRYGRNKINAKLLPHPLSYPLYFNRFISTT